MEVAAYDANGDGNDDSLLNEFSEAAAPGGLQRGTMKQRVVLGDGAGFFNRVADVQWPAGHCALSHLAASTPVDLDGDGTFEVVHECHKEGYQVLGWDGGTGGTLVLKDVGLLSGRVMPTWVRPGSPVATAAEGMLKFGDLYGDGVPEMIVGATHTAATWSVHKGQRFPRLPKTVPRSCTPRRPAARRFCPWALSTRRARSSSSAR